MIPRNTRKKAMTFQSSINHANPGCKLKCTLNPIPAWPSIMEAVNWSPKLRSLPGEIVALDDPLPLLSQRREQILQSHISKSMRILDILRKKSRNVEENAF